MVRSSAVEDDAWINGMPTHVQVNCVPCERAATLDVADESDENRAVWICP